MQATPAAATLVTAVARDRGFPADDNAKLLTEPRAPQLRMAMRHYRTLLNYICQP